MKLSIITINYNNLEGLRKTMESVLAQTCHDFEYIVIDGASTDGSAKYIQAHAGRLTYWVSEPDNGIYHAMNKGVRAATGDYVLMLNSGDYLVDNQVVGRVLPELDGTDIVQGNIIEQHDDGLWRNRGYGRSELTFLDIQRGHFLHQASFCRRELFDQYGYFDESYRYVSDTKFFVNCLGYGNASFRYVNVDVANFDMTGFSNSRDEIIRKAHAAEERRLDRELFSSRLLTYCLDSGRKIQFYDNLRRHRCIWNMLMLIFKLSGAKHVNPSVCKREKI